MTRPLYSRSRDVRAAGDSLLNVVEMALDEYGLQVINGLKAWGYSDAIAWAAACAARDSVLCLLEAEERRRAQLATREASIRVREGLTHG